MEQAYGKGTAPSADFDQEAWRCAQEDYPLANIESHRRQKGEATHAISDCAPVKNGGETLQAWVKATIWHPTRSSCRLPVEVLIDTGAGGGNYASESFVFAAERNAKGGWGIISSKGKCLLTAANPIQSGVSPRYTVGSCDIPLVFMPEDPVRRMTVRVVEGQPYRLILGAAFLRQHGSVLNFAGGGGFKPAPE